MHWKNSPVNMMIQPSSQLLHLLSHRVILGQVEFLLGIVKEVVECHRVNICIPAPRLVIVPCTAGGSFTANNQLVILHSNGSGHSSRKLEQPRPPSQHLHSRPT